jgi:branched-subunit amino acid transport protein AzlD
VIHPFVLLEKEKTNYTGQQISKKMFVSVMNMLLIYFFAAMKLEKGH